AFKGEITVNILVASIVFISFGVVAAFCCAIVDGVFAARHIDPRPLYTRRCQFYSSGIGFLYDAYQTEVTCYTLSSKCQLRVKSNTCYCCDLYNCENSEQSTSYYEFLGVNSCQDVVHLYRLLWASTVLNIVGLFLGIVTAAILGAFKDMVRLASPAVEGGAACLPAPECSSTPPSGGTHFPASSSTDISLSDDTQPPSQSSSNYGLPPNAPPLYTPTYFLPEEKPPPYAP
uniref:Transmembrane protein 255B n=1 Tax=Chrysemys picta bellii TaxID=8478 RepID=A0A8C3IE60_CHRPI